MFSMGICGGYQMMGREISDPDGVEGEVAAAEGLCLLPTSTALQSSSLIILYSSSMSRHSRSLADSASYCLSL